MTRLKERFRGFLPVVIDVETSGIDPNKHAILEIAAVLLKQEQDGTLERQETLFEHVIPFPDAELDPASLAFNHIDPFQPLRYAVEEKLALERLFKSITKAVKHNQCQRAVLVGHNAWFDLLFVNKAASRNHLRSPFHAFTCFDTATLSAFLFGQTVLSKALHEAKIAFDPREAHSAIYDAEKTADLFCQMVNTWIK